MNEQDRAELQSLKEQQSELLRQVSVLAEGLRGKEALLDTARRDLQQLRATQSSLDEARRGLESKIRRFESRLEAPVGEMPRSTATQPISPHPHTVHPLPPPIPGTIPPVIPTSTPTPRRPTVSLPAASESTAAPQPRQPAQAHAQVAVPAAKLSEFRAESPKPPPPPTAAPAPKSSFEMRLGTYWLVRIGIVMLLTGVVFLGTYAYKNFIGHFGPAGKLTLLYLLSGTLLALGTWFHRKQESLKNYAQVLFAGGLAAVYFSTYAAYHIPALQVIRSAVLDGALLFGWAAYVVWLADRRKSETLALFAVGLAFYSSVITHVGLFTLYSNLILTIAAVFFLVRNRWATLSFATM
ncbi:MAG TPA: DUF2339 domain-containing protein, partial [Verrucomicrobiae bacterium]|nr:DUF2339 domain-containing protein [Verrucomicrobiae bacterium]